MASQRSRSVPACPFWSEKARDEHELMQSRPAALEARETPLPADDDWDETPPPLQDIPSGAESRVPTVVFQTPKEREPSDLKPEVTEPHLEQNLEVRPDAAPDPATQRAERPVWRRRAVKADDSQEVLEGKTNPSRQEVVLQKH